MLTAYPSSIFLPAPAVSAKASPRSAAIYRARQRVGAAFDVVGVTMGRKDRRAIGKRHALKRVKAVAPNSPAGASTDTPRKPSTRRDAVYDQSSARHPEEWKPTPQQVR